MNVIPPPVKGGKLTAQITWDDKSLFIRGERIMIFSGEFHPFRRVGRFRAIATCPC